MKFLAVFLFVFCMLCSIVTAASSSDSFGYHTNIVSVAPFRLVGLVNPGIEGSYEHLVSTHYAIRIGGVLHANLANTAGWSNYRGYRLMVEGRKYLHSAAHLRTYAALGLSYFHARYDYVYMMLPENRDPNTNLHDVVYDDSVGIHNSNFSMNGKLGLQCRTGHVLLDVYFGLGLRYKVVTHHGRLHPEDVIYQRHPNIPAIAGAVYHGFTLSMPLNVAVGYTF